MWNELIGNWTYGVGVSGTYSVPIGGRVLRVRAEAGAGATVSIFGKPAIPFTGTLLLDFKHLLVQAQQASGVDIVFTNTTAYYVEFLRGPGQ